MAAGTWSRKGDDQTRVLVNAAGLWGREAARLAGLEPLLMPLEHQYFVTEEIPEVAALDFEPPAAADRTASTICARGEGLSGGRL